MSFPSKFLNFNPFFNFLLDRDSKSGKMLNEYLLNREYKLSDEAVHLLFSANRWEERENSIKDL